MSYSSDIGQVCDLDMSHSVDRLGHVCDLGSSQSFDILYVGDLNMSHDLSLAYLERAGTLAHLYRCAIFY